MVYTSENLSLAALELFVHVSPDLLPADLISILARLPDTVTHEEVEAADLPDNWRDFPALTALQTIGTAWLKRKTSVALLVPSAINPLEKNILLNPVHPDISRLRIENTHPFHFDPRLFGK